MTTITICTPWLNHLELAADYWAAVRCADAEVLIVDNGSAPPLPNAIRRDWNLGFSGACNIGLRYAQTDAVLFLNNDIAATSRDWLEPIREALEPGVLVGANLVTARHADVDGIPMPYLDGWCLAGMIADLRALGGWDEDYLEPSYYGDNDLCLRARAEGFALREAQVGLRHKVNATSSDNDFSAAAAANHHRYVQRARTLLEAA